MKLNKRGQFFILAAVILAVIILGLGMIYNKVNVPESSKKFYSYSAQLNEETGAIVDYSLYSGNSKVADFVNKSVESVLNSYPDLDIFICYTISAETINCDNYGSYNITIYLPSGATNIGPGIIPIETSINNDATTRSIYRSPSSNQVNIASLDNIIIESGGINYTIDLTKAQASTDQYYFVFRANTTAGNLLSAQEGSS